jgi:predicted GNAT family N-acyltransferase/predicted HAD superfamily Cof-like phosphohydrolase
MLQIISFQINDLQHAQPAFAIRKEVFVVEQEVSETDEFDEFESTSTHYLLYYHQQPVAVCRWRHIGDKIKFERFAVLKNYRNMGFGSMLLYNALNETKHFNKPIYLHAQLAAVEFYARHGFVAQGDIFDECNILHYKMYYQPDVKSKSKMMHFTNAVAVFHQKFNIPKHEQPIVEVPETIKHLRYNLMKEENEEYLEAALKNNLIEVADALGDKLYILCGTLITHGLQYKIQEIFDEIQQSNLSKLGADGKPIYREDGKVMKGPGYFKPNIKKILE